jgi:hypothetical protein
LEIIQAYLALLIRNVIKKAQIAGISHEGEARHLIVVEKCIGTNFTACLIMGVASKK